MLEILNSSCATAEFLGVSGSGVDVLKAYTVSRNTVHPVTGLAQKANLRLGVSNAHAFVVITFSDYQKGCKELEETIKKKKLGKVWVSEQVRNPNHGGWKSVGVSGSKCTAVLYQPDHARLTKWYQKNYQKDYELK